MRSLDRTKVTSLLYSHDRAVSVTFPSHNFNGHLPHQAMNASVVRSPHSSTRHDEPSKDDFYSCELQENSPASLQDDSSHDDFYSCDGHDDESLGEIDETETFSMAPEVMTAKRRRDEMRRKLEKERRRGRRLQARIDGALEELHMFRRLVEIKKANHKKCVEPHVPENAPSHIPPRRNAFRFSLLGNETKQELDLERKPAARKKPKVDPYVGRYVLGAFLGEGAFGSVFVGKHYTTHKEFAIKMIDKDKIGRSRRRRMAVEREAYVLKSLQHPNIIRLHAIVHCPTHICLIMELGCTDLLSWVHYQRNEMNDIGPRVCREIILGIIKPMKHLHSLGIAHLDVKEDNILVTKDVSVDELTQEHIKLCDFGLCKMSSDAEGQVERTGIVGTPGYFAPEMAMDDYYDACAADMFSVGCTLLNLFGKVPRGWNRAYRKCLDHPADFRNRLQVLTMILHCDDTIFEGLAFPAIQIIRGLLSVDPEKRLTAAQALNWLGE